MKLPQKKKKKLSYIINTLLETICCRDDDFSIAHDQNACHPLPFTHEDFALKINLFYGTVP